MPVYWKVMDRGRRLSDASLKRVETCVKAAVHILEQKCPDLDADLALIPTDILEHPKWYRSGKAFGPGYAQVEFNPDHPRFDTDWEDEGAALVIHELHHCLRWKDASTKWTIGEVIVLEGLAMLAERASEKRALDYGEPPSSKILEELCEKAFLHRTSPEGEDTSWFRAMHVDSEVLDAPVNYYIGKTMMEVALDALGLDPFQAIKVPSSTLLSTWKAARNTTQ